MSHIPPKGYEDVAFFGRNSQSCLHLEEGTPYEAACKCRARHEGSYILEEDAGWTVYAPVPQEEFTDPELSAEDLQALREWLDTPVENHIARWESEISNGLRDESGKWIGGPRHGLDGNSGQTE